MKLILSFYDDDLTWGVVSRANGVRELIKYTRCIGKSTATDTTLRVQKPTIKVVSDEDDNDEEE